MYPPGAYERRQSERCRSGLRLSAVSPADCRTPRAQPWAFSALFTLSFNRDELRAIERVEPSRKWTPFARGHPDADGRRNLRFMSQFTPTQRKSRLYENHPLRSRAHPREPVFLSFGLGPRSKWYNHAADAPDLDRDHAYYLYHVEFKGSNVNDHWGLVLYQETGHGAHASEGRLHHIVEPQAKVTGPRAADLHHAIVDHADPSHAKDKYKSETLLARVPEGLVDDVERVVSEASGEEHPWITRNPRDRAAKVRLPGLDDSVHR